MAAVERGELNGGALGWSFLVVGSTDNIEEVDRKLPREQCMAMSQTIQDANTVSIIPRNWVLLDNQSTVHVFSSAGMLINIRQIDLGIYIHCDAGATSINWVGNLPGFGTVWYHNNGIENILSLEKVKERFRVTYDSGNGDEFVVPKLDGKKRCFKESRKDLFFTTHPVMASRMQLHWSIQ